MLFPMKNPILLGLVVKIHIKEHTATLRKIIWKRKIN